MSPEIRAIVLKWRENYCAHTGMSDYIDEDGHCSGCVRDVDENYVYLITDLFELLRRDVVQEISNVSGLAVALKGDVHYAVKQAKLAANRVLVYHLSNMERTT